MATIILNQLVDKIEEKCLLIGEEGRIILSTREDQKCRRKYLSLSEAIVPLGDLLNIRVNSGVAVKADDSPR